MIISTLNLPYFNPKNSPKPLQRNLITPSTGTRSPPLKEPLPRLSKSRSERLAWRPAGYGVSTLPKLGSPAPFCIRLLQGPSKGLRYHLHDQQGEPWICLLTASADKAASRAAMCSTAAEHAGKVPGVAGGCTIIQD